MSLQVMLQEQISCAQALLQRAEQLSQEVEGRGKLYGKLRAELRFLRRMEAGEVLVKKSHLHSTNLTHLTAIVESAESLQGVVSLLHVFTYQSATGSKQTLVVDVVANGGHTWVKAVGRKAEALHNIWQGRGQYGTKSIIRQAEDFLEASRQQPVQYLHPHTIFAFYNGVSSPMADRLKEMGVSVRGDIVGVNTVALEENGEDDDDEEEEEEEEQEESGSEEGTSSEPQREPVEVSRRGRPRRSATHPGSGPAASRPSHQRTTRSLSHSQNQAAKNTHAMPEYVEEEERLVLERNPLEWSVSDVVEYITSTDCASLAKIFQEQDIDGQALLLLTLPTVQECMDLKLGPAIKLCHQIERVKVAFYSQYAN